MLYRGKKSLLEFPLRTSRVLVGRSDRCDLVVPSGVVSRTHCVLTRRDGNWCIDDRSRHGTFVDQNKITGKQMLQDGATIELGAYRMSFKKETQSNPARTISRIIDPVPPEKLLRIAGNEVSVERPMIRVVAGPAEGRCFSLRAHRQSLGAAGSDLVLDEDDGVLPGHVGLAVARGRTMLLPGTGMVYLDGERVLSALPVYPGERFRLGDTICELAKVVHDEVVEAESFGLMVGKSASIRRVFGLLAKMADHAAPVLLMGESGTGKELAAQGLHSEGRRARGPFVAINCGAISEKLFESELFGHEKGAFTDAKERRDGAFQRANRGTLFLDEIGELPLAAQAKLLRALETGEVRRVGASTPSFPDVRVVAATNRDLEKEVKQGRFREDLFYRLAVLGVGIPALRHRVEDIEALTHILSERLGDNISVSMEAIRLLEFHPFPGNVRELRNVLTRAYVLGGRQITASSIQFSPWPRNHVITTHSETGTREKSRLKESERSILVEAFTRLQGNRSAMARELGVPRTTLHYKLKRFGISSVAS